MNIRNKNAQRNNFSENVSLNNNTSTSKRVISFYLATDIYLFIVLLYIKDVCKKKIYPCKVNFTVRQEFH